MPPHTPSQNEQEPKIEPAREPASGIERRRSVPVKVSQAIDSFTMTEKISFFVLVAALAASAFMLLTRLNSYVTVQVPAIGGSFSEGVIGSPRFINPLLAISDTDRDLTALIYSGLLKTGADGSLLPDLAESYTVSADGLTYDFALRPGIVFQDGTPVTADDVVYTIQEAQDPNLKSPKRVNFDGTTVVKVDDAHVRFMLKQPYAPFLANLTIGILPSHLWKNVTADEFAFSAYNANPVGSGPYLVKKIVRDTSGLPLFYDLAAFQKHAQGQAYIQEAIIHFYANTDALENDFKNRTIEAAGAISPADIPGLLASNPDARAEETPSSRIFGVFFNQNHAGVFLHKEVRQALDMAADKDAIVAQVLGGYGTSIDGPIPPGSLPGELSTTTASDPDAAIALLKKKGWTINPSTNVMELVTKSGKTTSTTPLAFTLSTSDAPDLVKAANLLKSQWEKIGANVTVKIFQQGDLNQNVIRPRSYDALLFGEIVGRDLDLFAFWHSSERQDPGLNIALYANSAVDKLLEKARTETDPNVRAQDYVTFDQDIQADVPAVFLYSSDFLYIVPSRIQGITLGQIDVSSERFSTIASWNIESDRIWSFITKLNIPH